MRSLKTKPWLLVLVAGLLLSQTLSAVTFTVTPSSVSNTYNGTITLLIGGLTNGETVVIQKYLDVNASGVLAANDLLVQDFQLTVGQIGALVIGGVTNINMPVNSNTNTNAITATFNFQNGDSTQNYVGQYLFVLSSPSNQSYATNILAVTNAYAQKFTGTVVNSTNGASVPNAVVLLLLEVGGNDSPIEGVVANNAGLYTIEAPVGTYALVAFKSNFVANTSAAANLVLSSGQTLTTNLSLIAATETISGKMVDATTSNGLPGLTMNVQTASENVLASGLTDSNGNFNIGVTSNQWNIQGNREALGFLGYLGLGNKVKINATNGSVSNVTISATKATALFYGYVTNNLGNPLPGVDIHAGDNNGLYETDAYTAANGYYVAGAVGGLGANDPWQVEVNNASSFPSDIFSQPPFDQNGGANLGVGQAMEAGFSAVVATNTISGYLTDGSGNPIANVGIEADDLSNTNFQAYVDTGANGSYSLNVANGTWSLAVNTCSTCGGSDYLPVNYIAPPNQTVVISNDNGTANFTAILPSNFISGYLTNSGGSPFAGVEVYANTNNNSQNVGAQTDTNGYYSIGVVNGTWTVSVNTCSNCGNAGSLPGNYIVVQSETVVISNDNGAANFTAYAANNTISGSLKDGNGDPIAGVGMYANIFINSLYYNQTAVTASNGDYSMNVANGTWSVGVNSCSDCGGGLPGNYCPPPSQSVVISNDNGTANFIASSGSGITVTTTNLPSGQVNVYYDQNLLAAGCGSPFTWSLSSGSLPPGLIYGSSPGVIFGTPTNVGTFNFTFQVSGGSGNSTNQNLSIYIAPSNAPMIDLTAPQRLGSNQFQFSFNSALGVSYTIQYSTNLESWIPFLTNGGSGKTETVIDSNASGATPRYYRVFTP
jgi:hypothetical protein